MSLPGSSGRKRKIKRRTRNTGGGSTTGALYVSAAADGGNTTRAIRMHMQPNITIESGRPGNGSGSSRKDIVRGIGEREIVADVEASEAVGMSGYDRIDGIILAGISAEMNRTLDVIGRGSDRTITDGGQTASLIAIGQRVVAASTTVASHLQINITREGSGPINDRKIGSTAIVVACQKVTGGVKEL